MHHHVDIFWRAIVGISFPVAGAVTSSLPHVEQWLRICSLLIGMAVGIATLISIIKRRNRD